MAKKVILLTNLGSPDSTKVSDVRTYLNEFLMDGRVIDVPYLLRLLLVKGLITPFRARKSAEAYRSIWTDEGSPLIHISKGLQKLVQDQTNIPTYLSMRYGNPASEKVMKNIVMEHPNLETLVMLPLYPHYAMSSYETAVEQIKDIYKSNNYQFDLNIVPAFYDDAQYIDALSKSIKPYLENDHDLVLFSYHGIPERHVRKTDITKNHCLKTKDCCNVDSEAHQYCYRHQVFKTTELVTKQLEIPKEKYMVSFQSRLGRDPWLTPFTADLFEELPKEGIKNLIVICPAFVSDCLETLEEIQMEGKEEFLKAGGNSMITVPCLNLDDNWVTAIEHLVEKNFVIH